MSWSKERSEEEQRFIRRKCNKTPTLSNTAEIVENESRGSLTPLRWSSFKLL